MASDNSRIPKQHDRVSPQGHDGVFSVVDVDERLKTVSLQTVTGNGPVLENIPWSALRYMTEENAE